mgnify:CR=1 FL=1
MLHQHRDLVVLELALEPFLPELRQDPIQIVVGEITDRRFARPVQPLPPVAGLRLDAQAVQVDRFAPEIRDGIFCPGSKHRVDDPQIRAAWVRTLC